LIGAAVNGTAKLDPANRVSTLAPRSSGSRWMGRPGRAAEGAGAGPGSVGWGGAARLAGVAWLGWPGRCGRSAGWRGAVDRARVAGRGRGRAGSWPPVRVATNVAMVRVRPRPPRWIGAFGGRRGGHGDRYGDGQRGGDGHLVAVRRGRAGGPAATSPGRRPRASRYPIRTGVPGPCGAWSAVARHRRRGWPVPHRGPRVGPPGRAASRCREPCRIGPRVAWRPTRAHVPPRYPGARSGVRHRVWGGSGATGSATNCRLRLVLAWIFGYPRPRGRLTPVSPTGSPAHFVEFASG
jgi:hypothetical protein